MHRGIFCLGREGGSSRRKVVVIVVVVVDRSRRRSSWFHAHGEGQLEKLNGTESG